jgi:hypothetical protein
MGTIQGVDSSNRDLSQGDIQPGTKVSIDQYISGVPGCLTHTRGKEDKKTQYNGGTLFVDNCRGYIHHKNKVSLRIGETLKGKHSFDCFFKQLNVMIKHYHADNAPFGANEFKSDIANQDQEITFSGVGANHQNGVAERSIRIFTQWARAMLIHSILHWPEVADLKLWPFAIDHAIFLWNNMPYSDTLLAPIEVFTSTKFQNHKQLGRCHVWGSPVFVLDPALQESKKIPKWNTRSRLGIYLGNSRVQSSTVARVLNLRTGYITAQYHTVSDDLFSTFHNDGMALGLLTPEFWNGLLRTGLKYNVVADYDRAGNLIPPPPLQDEWMTRQERQVRDEARTRLHQQRTQTIPLQYSDAPAPDLVQGMQPLCPP